MCDGDSVRAWVLLLLNINNLCPGIKNRIMVKKLTLTLDSA